MLQRIVASLYEFLTSMVRLYTLPQLLGFGVMFTTVVIVSAKQRFKPGRFFRRAFRTDLAHSVWFPVYTVLIGIPLSLRLAGMVINYAPFLRLRLFAGLPSWLNLPLWFIGSDFALYWLHRSLHRSRWLWALHKIHHSQQELNPLTTWRVHWLEFVYLNAGTFATGLLFGDLKAIPPILIAMLAASQFAQHSDLDWTYGPLGRVIVSPRFHARHHSTAPEDLNVNFGSLLVIWDRFFGTARDVPGRAPAYGLVAVDDDVPASFFGQQLYPLSILFLGNSGSLVSRLKTKSGKLSN